MLAWQKRKEFQLSNPILQMSDALQVLLDSGGLYFALGAVLCNFLDIGAVRHLFQGANRAAPPDPHRRLQQKD
jgi:hypothetical protein